MEEAPASMDLYQLPRNIDPKTLTFNIGKKGKGKGQTIYVKGPSGGSVYFRLGDWNANCCSDNPQVRMAAVSELPTVTSPFHMSQIDQETHKKKESSLILMGNVHPADLAALDAIMEEYVQFLFREQSKLWTKTLDLANIRSKVKPLVEENNGMRVLRTKVHYPEDTNGEVNRRATKVYMQSESLRNATPAVVEGMTVGQPFCFGCQLGGMTVLSEFIATTVDVVLACGAFVDYGALARDPVRLFTGMSFGNDANAAPCDSSMDQDGDIVSEAV